MIRSRFVCHHATRAETRAGCLVYCTTSPSDVPRRPTRYKPRRPAKKHGQTNTWLSSIVESSTPVQKEHTQTPTGEVEDKQTALDAAISAGKWNSAVNYAHAIISMKSEIDASSLNLLFQGACSKRHLHSAIALYNRLDDRRQLLDYRTYHSFIQSAMESGAYEYGVKLYHDVKKSGYSLNPVTYSVILSGLLRDKRRGSRSHTTAYEIWAEIKDNVKNIDVILFRAGCQACVAVGKIQEAENLIPVMKRLGFHPDHRFYNTLIKGQCRCGNMKAAMAYFERVKSEGIKPTQTSYNTLIQGFIENKQTIKAESFLEYAISEGHDPDLCSYTTLMKGFVNMHRMHDVERIFDTIKERNLSPNEVTYGVLIDGLVRQGKLVLAFERLREMQRSGIEPNLIIYNTLLKGCAVEGNHARSNIIWLLREMKRNRINPGIDTMNTILSNAKEAPFSEASVAAFFEEMERLEFLPDAVSYTILLKAAHRKGDLDQCRTIFRTMKASTSVQIDLVCWNLMVAILCKSGEMMEAEQMLHEAVKFAQDKNQAIPVEAFGAIIHGYVQRQDLSTAVSKFRWFCSLGGLPDKAMMDLLLRTCIAKREISQALKLLRAAKLLGVEVSWDKYSNLIQILEKENVQMQSIDVGLERLKFWLGIPNNYYSSEWP